MSLPKISICVFIRDNNSCAFGLWESMATLMPLADEFFVLDLGSTDGTFEILKDLASHNPKIRLEQGEFPINPVTGLIDAGSFAEIPNAMIPTCKNDLVMYYQADEIWHEDLVIMLRKKLREYNPKTFRGLSFWRYQLTNNFQHVKWFPHLIHRIDHKDRFTFVDDGMNTNRTNEAEICSDYDGGWFVRWGEEFQDHSVTKNYKTLNEKLQSRKGWGTISHSLPTHQMVLDISSTGGFLENVGDKMRKHAPLWRNNELDINIGGESLNFENWFYKQKKNSDWNMTESPFNIPAIMRPLVGQTRYPVREDILQKIRDAI
jgi:hypothetical protein